MAKTKPKARAKVRRYDEGGDIPADVQAANQTDDPIYALGKSRGWFKEDDAAPAKAQTFGQAFKAARAAGDATFSWNGKKFTTEMAGEKSTTPRAKASASSASNKFGAFDPGAGGNSWMDMPSRPAEEPGLEGVYPEQYLLGPARAVLGPAKAALGASRALATTARSRAAPALKEYVMPLLGQETRKLTGPAAQRALTDNATRMLTGPTKAEVMADQIRRLSAPDRSAVMNKAAWAAGPGAGMGLKKGGVVKMAKGGSVSSASKRADGIARKGLTKGRMR